MSIIYNALKKTQATQQVIAEQEQQIEIVNKTKAFSLLPVLLVSGMLFIALMLVFFILHAETPPAPIIKPKPVIALTLNGVFLTPKDKIAVINNHEYHMGNTINGMKIIAMDMNSVTLKSGDQRIKIRAS